MADTPFNLLELPGVFEPGVYASVVYDSDPGLAAHRIGFALVRVRTPYPSFRMATHSQLENAPGLPLKRKTQRAG